MDYKKSFQVGLLFLIGVVLLIISTIIISKSEIFMPSYKYAVIFDTASALGKGDQVRVSGVNMGEVYSIKLLRDTKVKVVLRLREQIKFYEDYEIRIEESSLLGGNFISIDQGTPTKREVSPKKEPLKGLITLSGLEKLGQFVAENQNDIKNFLQKAIGIVHKMSAGEGTIGKLINDDTLYNNLKDSSDSLKKVSKQIEEGKGLLGKIVFDENLSNQLSQAGDAATKILAPVVQTKVYLGVDSKYYAKSEATISDIFLKIYPHEWRYFLIGASFMSFNKNGIVDFKNKQVENKNQTFIKADLQLAYTFPWGNQRFTFRPGLLEGKIGGGIDWEIPVTTTGIFPMAISLEGRDAYNSIANERIDENLHGSLYRAYVTLKFGRYFQAYLGASRLFDKKEDFMGGFCFSYPDNDIKSVVTLFTLTR